MALKRDVSETICSLEHNGRHGSRAYPQDNTGKTHMQTHTQVKVWTHTFLSHPKLKKKQKNILQCSQKWTLIYVSFTSFSASPSLISSVFLPLACLSSSSVSVPRSENRTRVIDQEAPCSPWAPPVCLHVCVCLITLACMCQQDRWTQLSTQHFL